MWWSTRPLRQGRWISASYKQLGSAFLAGFADLHDTVLEQIEEGNKVVSRVAWGGTHTGTLNGIPPTGRSFNTESIVIDTVVNGKIAERREVSDMFGYACSSSA